jgi:hypothetical protein
MSIMRPSSLKARAFAIAALALAGCGLISSDITKLTFDLPTQTYTFDTSMWGNLPAGTVPAVPCTSSTDCCTAGALAGVNCSTTPLDCNAGTCEAAIPESVSSPINLASDVPQLSGFANHGLSQITISKITYSVSNNTLNIDLPAMTIYLAPDKVTDPNDPKAVVFGTTMPIPAGTDPTNQPVMLVSNAAQVFGTFTTDISMPFTLIAATVVKIEAGQPVPSGAITIAVTGVLSAQI